MLGPFVLHNLDLVSGASGHALNREAESDEEDFVANQKSSATGEDFSKVADVQSKDWAFRPRRITYFKCDLQT